MRRTKVSPVLHSAKGSQFQLSTFSRRWGGLVGPSLSRAARKVRSCLKAALFETALLVMTFSPPGLSRPPTSNLSDVFASNLLEAD